MQFKTPQLNQALTDFQAAADETERCVGWSLHSEEQVGLTRLAAYEQSISLPTVPGTYRDWAQRHEKKHIPERIFIADSNSVPDTFLALNDLAQFSEIEENQWLVRVENITTVLPKTRLQSISELTTSFLNAANGDLAAQDIVNQFVQDWNGRRDARPMFAAFKSELDSEFNDVDWPHLLRDRLGLGHLNPRDGGAFEVAVMCYPVKTVLQHARRFKSSVPAAFCRPTVLDSEFNTFFVPVPAGATFGAALHLGANSVGHLTSELLHLRIDYESSHLVKIGRIDRQYQMTGTLSQARSAHLASLRARGLAQSWGNHP